MLRTPLKRSSPTKTFYLLLLITFASLSANAQKLTENSVVKDSSGTVYPEVIWRALLLKGRHTLKPVDKKDPNTAFLLVGLSDEEREARLLKMPRPKESLFFKTGDQFKLGKLTDIQGNKIDLKNNVGKITVVNFWFINCSPCRLEIPELNILAKKYGSDSVRFVGIALDDRYKLKEFLQTMPFDYQIIDEGRSYAERYGVKSYPTHLILDQEGKVYFPYNRFIFQYCLLDRKEYKGVDE